MENKTEVRHDYPDGAKKPTQEMIQKVEDYCKELTKITDYFGSEIYKLSVRDKVKINIENTLLLSWVMTFYDNFVVRRIDNSESMQFDIEYSDNLPRVLAQLKENLYSQLKRSKHFKPNPHSETML